MAEPAISPLRPPIIEDMPMDDFVKRTQKEYIRHVKDLTAFLRHSPEGHV